MEGTYFRSGWKKNDLEDQPWQEEKEEKRGSCVKRKSRGGGKRGTTSRQRRREKGKVPLSSPRRSRPTPSYSREKKKIGIVFGKRRGPGSAGCEKTPPRRGRRGRTRSEEASAT